MNIAEQTLEAIVAMRCRARRTGNGTMGRILDEHVEWAVVNRLKAMLDEPPNTKFNVTQSFALFSAVLLWTKNRAWAGGNRGAGHNRKDRPHWFGEADHAARDARDRLQQALICDPPWLLSQVRPRIMLADRDQERPLVDQRINSDFAQMSAESFVKWLRDALAHGDGRTIKPIHKRAARGDKTLLAGVEITFPEKKRSNRKLSLALYHDDMRRIGATLADLFCQALSGGERAWPARHRAWLRRPASSLMMALPVSSRLAARLPRL